MATTDKPSRLFDAFGLRSTAAVRALDPPAPEAAPSIPQSERLAVAQGLRDLGYRPAQIELILGGPSMTSIEGLTGRMIRAKSLPMDAAPVEETATYDAVLGDAGTGTRSEPASTEKPRAPEVAERKFPGRADVLSYRLGIDQADIIDAVWHNLHGDPNKLASIADNFEMLTGPLQAYVSAAVESGKIFLVDLNKWVADFNKAQAKSAKERAEADKQRKKTVGSIAGIAAAAANAIPVVGQLLALAIAAGVAISEAIQEAFPLPLREGADQVHDEFEGLDAFWGLTNYYSDTEPLPARQDRYLSIKQAVVQDSVATLLPIPRSGSRYKFTPSIDQFRRAAHELGLYEGEGNTVVEPPVEVKS